MSAARKCPQCGAPLPAEGWEGLCPKCLVRVSLEDLEGMREGEKRGPKSSLASPTEDARPTETTVAAGQSALLAEGAGMMIGRYKLLQQIGEGGFGAVFMAEQTEPVQRKVALKIIKAGMDTKDVVARFESEQQALALMDHPSSARVERPRDRRVSAPRTRPRPRFHPASGAGR
jgi:endogenous inhibitor of DNA gyrase (YacG/DUF329 family)